LYLASVVFAWIELVGQATLVASGTLVVTVSNRESLITRLDRVCTHREKVDTSTILASQRLDI